MAGGHSDGAWRCRGCCESHEAGAIEFLEKPFSPEVLDHAVDQAFRLLDQGEHVVSERDQARYVIAQLTARESETTTKLMEGVPVQRETLSACDFPSVGRTIGCCQVRLK